MPVENCPCWMELKSFEKRDNLRIHPIWQINNLLSKVTRKLYDRFFCPAKLLTWQTPWEGFFGHSKWFVKHRDFYCIGSMFKLLRWIIKQSSLIRSDVSFITHQWRCRVKNSSHLNMRVLVLCNDANWSHAQHLIFSLSYDMLSSVSKVD